MSQALYVMAYSQRTTITLTTMNVFVSSDASFIPTTININIARTKTNGITHEKKVGKWATRKVTAEWNKKLFRKKSETDNHQSTWEKHRWEIKVKQKNLNGILITQTWSSPGTTTLVATRAMREWQAARQHAEQYCTPVLYLPSFGAERKYNPLLIRDRKMWLTPIAASQWLRPPPAR